ncbi:neurobeachin-like isoform X1 [Mizuhopecten yessoensis]|uniref:neurobeachin-like isoform X1 n=1 Tax=Mizuhopecten yessoensis TaxID=6573 RepID=UPI000B458683|nr:neurobeachin-like isoform X1 [Mizuhopecten yessoensis]
MSSTEGEGEAQVTTTEGILKAAGNDELKFGLLIGLIKVKQVTNKDVVNTVLHLLVGEEFDIESNFIIQEPQNILHTLRLLTNCPVTLQAEIWSVFTAILKKSRRNLQACTEVGLIEHALNLLKDTEDVIADLMVEMLGVLATYSITVRELKMLISLLKAMDGKWPQHSVKLLSVLKLMPRRDGPDEFFSFPGKIGSHISLPPIKTWPYQNGWTFSCWLRLDPVTGVTVERERPYLYCFRTNKGVGYSANFLGNSLVLTAMKVKGKGFQHCVKHDFQPRKWYMVTLVYVYNRWSKSELRCYVDGKLVSHTEMSWLVNTSDPFDKCFLGASSEVEADHMFCGQMSSVYLFSESLSPQQIAAIYQLGPNYKSQFRFENESGLTGNNINKKLVYDGKLTNSILFMYNPMACDSQLCLESSPKGNPSYFVHVQHALMSQDVKAVITQSIHSTLHSLGGVQVFFPLFGQLDFPVDKGDKSEVDHTICANLMSILLNLLESSVTIQQQMLQNKGFLVIGYLLEKASRMHVTPAVLETFLALTQYLVELPTGSMLLKHLFDHILFNPALWIHASVEVQTKLYCYLATDFISNAQIYNNIRRVSAVLQTMHTLKFYYWVVNPKDRSGITPKGTDGPRPTYDEIIKLRSFMLLYIKQLLLKGQGVQEDELQSILNYMSTLHEDDNLMDVLQLTVSLMAEHPASMVPSFDKKNGIRTVFKLLASNSEPLQIQSLKLLGFFLMRATHKRKADCMGPHNLFSLIGERLMLNEQSITLPVYNVLFELLTERLSGDSVMKKHVEPESYFRIENSAVLKVVATMIRQSKPTSEVAEVKKTFLSDLTILCNNNRENRRTVLQMSVWQDWLFSLSYIYSRNDEERKITDMVMSLFRMLLHHAIKFEYGGWRVWIDTLAILHSKVAYEDFKIHMSKMYRQYDQQRVDDVDPQERQNYPISTISGISDPALQEQQTQIKSSVQIKEVEKSSTEETKQEEKPETIQNGDAEGHQKDEEGKVEKAEGDGEASEDLKEDGKTSEEMKAPATNAKDDAAAGAKSEEVPDEKISDIPRGISTTGVRRNPSRAQSFRGSMESHGNRHVFSPGPRAPPFRIPEFRWSGLHQKLLSDLLFSVETDLQVWKSHSTKTVIDFVNSGDNHVYVVNVTHMISQLADNLITSCGGLLPLLAAATSPNGEVEILEPTQGLSIEQAVSILQRIMNMMDVLVFASSTNFAELEQEKNMPSGGILRQCLRLVCTSSVRNCLECRHRQRPHSPPGSPTSSSSRSSRNMNGHDPIQSLIMASHPTERNIIENLNEQTSPIKDYEKLLQDMDINRLRAVVYRDVEETKQAQFLALAIVYFTSVLMVSKYRDILEPPTPAATPTRNSHRQSINSPSDEELESGEEVGTSEGDLTQEITEEEEQDEEEPQGEPLQNNVDEEPRERVKIKADIHITDSTEVPKTTQTDVPVSGDNMALRRSIQSSLQMTWLDEDEDSESIDESSTDLNRTTDSADVGEEVEEKEDEDATEDKETTDKVVEGAEEKKEDEVEDKKEEEQEEEKEEEKSEEETATEQKVEDKPEDEQEEKEEAEGGSDPESTPQGSEATQEEGKGERPESEGQEAEEVQQKSSDAPKESQPVATSQRVDDPQSKPDNLPISAITVDVHSDRQQKPHLENLDLQAANMPMPVDNLPSLSGEGGSLTERLERALGPVAPLLREIFVDFAPFLSKTLIGSHGQELLIGGLVTLKQSTSVVELVMLLCSQEWQNSLQKHAGLAFIELVNEGRLLAHATRDHIVRVANEAEFILNRMRAEDVQKHAEFESLGAQTMLDRKEEEKLCDHLIKSAKRRDHVAAVKLRDKILNILSNKHGAWGNSPNRRSEHWKLDVWEDDSRRRRRLIKNPNGSSHPDATLKAAIEHGATEDAINQAREAFHAHLASTKRAQQTPDYTDEELLMEERDFEQDYAGPVALSTTCKLIAPGVMVNGTMAITKTEMYFEMDEDNEENKKMDPKVLSYVEHLHGRWHFNEVRAIFSRQYLLQNVAIEIFMANRTAVMFAFPDHATVKKVINALPRVGVGVKYGLPQARRMSLASGKQLFKLSCMTQKWQRREISNFDYLMYLNTIAGRTYNDLNQYAVFPWVIVNYESEELDLGQPNNFRDLSKPVGALNPTRKEFFDERYETWEHDQIPPFHYGTHFSTAAFTLNWLIRVEPFTTIFLNMQGGKFDHANRTFFSVAQAWKNCQRDTSDVKELIPEHFFLPEMLVNENGFNLGTQDDGLEVKDVIMPPWAKSPEDFIRTNRMALESEFVSCQLHHWIDLIFGYKQRGPEAVRSTNVFYYLTYEGSVDLESMTDPVMKEAIENQIRSFGQTPTQLLTEPHPPRSSVMHLATEKYKKTRSILHKTPMMFSTVQDDVCMIMKFLSNSPVTYVAANSHPAVPVPAVTTISCSHNFAINKWNPSYQQQGTPTSFSSEKPETQANLPLSMDQLLALNTGLQRRTLGDNFDERLKAQNSSFTTSADNRFIFACGFWDKSFRLFSTETAKILQVVHGHFDVVTCLTRSECNLNQDCYIITGSKDCTVMVWMFTARNMAIIGDNGSLEHPTPKATLTGHESEVTCVAVLAELGLVMSGSQNGPCLVHTLSGDLLRSLEAPEGCQTPQLITMSRESFVLVKFDEGHICNFSINGRLLLNVRHKDNIQSMILSRDGQYMMLGGSNGVVEVWRSHDLTLLYAYPPCDSEIRSLALTHDHKFLLAGLGTGCLLVFNIDFNKWHHEYQERY